jgi:transposase
MEKDVLIEKCLRQLQLSIEIDAARSSIIDAYVQRLDATQKALALCMTENDGLHAEVARLRRQLDARVWESPSEPALLSESPGSAAATATETPFDIDAFVPFGGRWRSLTAIRSSN